MSNVFSTNCKPVTCCPNPVMTIGFPRTGSPGPNTVVLANGAVVDLVELGRIISKFCPQFTCPAVGTQVSATPIATVNVPGLMAQAQLQSQAQLQGVQTTALQNTAQQVLNAAQQSQAFMDSAAAAQLGGMQAFDLIDG